MKKTLLTLLLFPMVALFSQETEKGTNKETLGATKDNEFSPRIFLGQITSNPATNNFGVDLTEQAINLRGIFYESNSGTYIWAMNVKGNNENNRLGVFGEGNLNAKLSGDMSVTRNLRSKIWYTTIDKNLSDSTDRYNEILRKNNVYHVNKQRFMFMTIGADISGAKYYLIDTSASFDAMVKKQNFNGWNLYYQFNILDYYNKKDYAIIHSFRASYGKINNTTDLTEYTINNFSNFTSGPNGQRFERRVTGYFDEYFVQYQGILSYEFSLFNMDTTSLKAGLIAGLDFVYNERQKNFFRFNVGLNFPVIFTRSGKDARRLYIGAILSTTDPGNYRGLNDYTFQKSLSASIRLVSPIKINVKSK